MCLPIRKAYSKQVSASFSTAILSAGPLFGNRNCDSLSPIANTNATLDPKTGLEF